METAAMGPWLAREWRRSATAWLFALLAALIGPACLLALPWSIVRDGSINYTYIGSIWFLSSFLGALVGLALLARLGGIWTELGRARQLGLAATVLFCLSTAYGLIGLGALRALGSVGGIHWLSALLCVGHWSALGTFIQRISMGQGAKWLSLGALGWWIPAFLAGAPEWDRVFWLLSPERHLGAGATPVDTAVGVLVDTIPIVAWWVAAALLPTRSAFRR